jgi:hypothetical protein
VFGFQGFNFPEQLFDLSSELIFCSAAVGPRFFELSLHIFDLQLELVDCVEMLFDFIPETSYFLVSFQNGI